MITSKPMKRKNLSTILAKCKNGKLVIIRGTENKYVVHTALKNALCVYCRVINAYFGPLEPPTQALKCDTHSYWNSVAAEQYIEQLVRLLDSYSPKGWHFHTPIFGVVLEWGWFRNYFFRNDFKKEIHF